MKILILRSCKRIFLIREASVQEVTILSSKLNNCKIMQRSTVAEMCCAYLCIVCLCVWYSLHTVLWNHSFRTLMTDLCQKDTIHQKGNDMCSSIAHIAKSSPSVQVMPLKEDSVSVLLLPAQMNVDCIKPATVYLYDQFCQQIKYVIKI